MSKILLSLVFATFIGSAAMADEVKAQAEFNTAKLEFAKRTAFSKDEACIGDAIKALDAALAQQPSNDLKYEILNYYTRILVWQGMHTATKKPEGIYETAMKKSDEARKLAAGAYDDKTEGHYYYAVAMGRWALEKGPLTVLSKTGDMKDALDAALKGDTMSGELGETYDSYGPDRVYGRLYAELPGFAGGDKTKALKHIETAYQNAPEHSVNSLYYAQILDKHDRTDEACVVIADLLAKNAATLIPDRAQEATEDFAAAKKFQTDNCLN